MWTVVPCVWDNYDVHKKRVRKEIGKKRINKNWMYEP